MEGGDPPRGKGAQKGGEDADPGARLDCVRRGAAAAAHDATGDGSRSIAGWMLRDRFAALTAEQRTKFPPLCPDFVIELRSPTDSLPALRSKMQEYIDNGARLGWLIDPLERQVHVYRPGSPVELLQQPRSVSAGPLLPGFTLDMADIW